MCCPVGARLPTFDFFEVLLQRSDHESSEAFGLKARWLWRCFDRLFFETMPTKGASFGLSKPKKGEGKKKSYFKNKSKEL